MCRTLSARQERALKEAPKKWGPFPIYHNVHTICSLVRRGLVERRPRQEVMFLYRVGLMPQYKLNYEYRRRVVSHERR